MNQSKVRSPRFWRLWRSSGAVASAHEVISAPVDKTVDYAKLTAPKNYKCDKCGATNCKLWRDYQIAFTDLLCCDCAARSEGEDIGTIQDDGSHQADGRKTDQIGWCVPCIPTESGLGFHVYGAIPPAAYNWWRRLPVRSSQTKSASNGGGCSYETLLACANPVFTLVVYFRVQLLGAITYGNSIFGEGTYAVELCDDPAGRVSELGEEHSRIVSFK